MLAILGNRGKKSFVAMQSGDDREGVAKLVVRRYGNGSHGEAVMVAAQLGLSPLALNTAL